MDIITIAQSVYAALDDNDVTSAVSHCLRLARLANDHLYSLHFLRELSSDRDEFTEAFASETDGFSDELRDFLYRKTTDRWFKARTIDCPDDSGNKLDKGVYVKSIGNLVSDIMQSEKEAAEAQTPQGLHPLDMVYREEANAAARGILRDNIRILVCIRERARRLCLDYATTLEKQVLNQRRQNSFVLEMQELVDNFLKSHHFPTFQKLQKAQELLGSTEPEDLSLALTEIRRATKSYADFVYPPQKSPVVCRDGIARTLDDSKYINRLVQHVSDHMPPNRSRELVFAQLEYVGNYLKTLNEMTSKGVHSTVSENEAKQALLGVYLCLADMIRLSGNLDRAVDSGEE